MNSREIDRLVAEKVMGWKLKKRWPDILVWENIEGEDRAADEATERYSVFEGFRPSTDISDAWEVVEKMKIKTAFSIRDVWDENDNPAYLANFSSYDGTREIDHTAYAETAPLAICLAALKAVWVEVE